jgi:hypothetical protein
MIKTLRGPGGIRVVLDTARVIPNDPGADTPAMVHLGRSTGTYWCVADTGELIDNLDGAQVTDAQSAWLDSIGDEVNAFLYPDA